MGIDVEAFVAERNAALRSLDKARITDYMTRWGIKAPADEETFWGAVHKARCWCNDFTDEEKNASARWLLQHGFRVV